MVLLLTSCCYSYNKTTKVMNGFLIPMCHVHHAKMATLTATGQYHQLWISFTSGQLTLLAQEKLFLLFSVVASVTLHCICLVKQ